MSLEIFYINQHRDYVSELNSLDLNPVIICTVKLQHESILKSLYIQFCAEDIVSHLHVNWRQNCLQGSTEGHFQSSPCKSSTPFITNGNVSKGALFDIIVT